MEVEYDSQGNQHLAYFPLNHEIDEYDSIVNPYKKELRKSNDHITDLLDKINMVEFNKLDLESYKKALTFKQESRKRIEPWIMYGNKMRGGIISDEELEEICDIITDFHDTVSVNKAFLSKQGYMID